MESEHWSLDEESLESHTCAEKEALVNLSQSSRTDDIGTLQEMGSCAVLMPITLKLFACLLYRFPVRPNMARPVLLCPASLPKASRRRACSSVPRQSNGKLRSFCRRNAHCRSGSIRSTMATERRSRSGLESGPQGLGVESHESAARSNC